MLLLLGSFVLSHKDPTSEGHVLRNYTGYTAQGEAISSHDMNINRSELKKCSHN